MIHRLNVLIATLWLAFAPAYAQVGQIPGWPPTQVVGGGGGCSQATTFLARTSGLSGTETSAYTTMICGMVTDGTWSKFDALYIFATNTTTTANLNLVSTSFGLTPTGAALTFTADHGYTGNGTSGFLDTGLVLTSATQYTLNSGAIGVYDLTNRTTNSNTFAMGVTNVSDARILILNTNFIFNINTTANTSIANTQAQGLWFVNRSSASLNTVYLNGNTGTPFGSSTQAAGSVPVTTSMAIFGQNTSGGIQQPTTDQFSAAWIGGGFTTTDVANVSSRINAFMTALGINVY